jgi:hypothetical protein
MAQIMVPPPRFFYRVFIRLSNFLGVGITGEISLVEVRVWCIKVGIVLVVHYDIRVHVQSKYGILRGISECYAINLYVCVMREDT